MRKILALILTATLILSLAGCQSGDDPAAGGSTPNEAGDSQSQGSDSPEENGDNAPEENGDNAPEETVSYSPLDILTTIWSSYPEDQKFAAAGGETMDGPGLMTGDYGTKEPLDSILALPQDSYELVSETACLMHMLNANTFTCGVFKLSSSEDASALASSLNDSIKNRQWMCGFPDKMMIATLGDCVISAFGSAEIMDTFKAELSSNYPDAVISYEENLI